MKQTLLLLTLFISLFKAHSQTNFEKGYFINNSGETIQCLIKNYDWQNNPVEFKYKISQNSALKTVTIKEVKEFGIDNHTKFERQTINIDRSSEKLNKISENRNPVFTEEQLFLKVLLEGKAKLYLYKKGNLKRYFFNVDNSNPEQLVFKSYKTSNNEIKTNNKFKQQLINKLTCPTITINKAERLEYKKNDLIKFFKDYNNCNISESTNYDQKIKRDAFAISLRPRLRNSSLDILSTLGRDKFAELGKKTSFGFGVEFEYILPFNNDKWSISVEPTYQNFKIKATKDLSDIPGVQKIVKASYESIEIPLTLRHYFFLNENSKIFINASFLSHLNLNSTIEVKNANNNLLETFEIVTKNNLGFGAGYKLHNKYSLEFRYQTDREILRDQLFWSSNYKNFSLILGYTVF